MFAVIELQKAKTLNAITTVHETREEADNKFYTILASASISKTPVHAAVILSEDGLVLANGSYAHEEK